MKCGGIVEGSPRRLMPFEILNRALVLLGRGTGAEGAKIAASASLRIFLARIKPVLAGCELADHRYLSRRRHSLPNQTSRQRLVPPRPANRPPARTRHASAGRWP